MHRYACPTRLHVPPVLFVDLVHRGEILHCRKEDVDFYYVLYTAAGCGQHGGQVLDDLVLEIVRTEIKRGLKAGDAVRWGQGGALQYGRPRRRRPSCLSWGLRLLGRSSRPCRLLLWLERGHLGGRRELCP